MSGMIDALGTSDVFLAFQEHLRQVTDSERPVLILGERGTGKELAAQRLHFLSRRWEKPCVTLLCPALSPSLLEAELFGHEAGAFTGARERRIGFIERADGGTLFLDEVADMPSPVQDKLLRVLEYGELVRVGGTRPIRVDVRVIAATNRPVHGQHGLRPDLLDRLACEVVHVPPLRVRGDDRMLLALHFATRLAVELGVPVGENGVSLGPKARQQLETYDWPGNVRELKNVIERSVIRSPACVVAELVLDPFTPPWPAETMSASDMGEQARAQSCDCPDTLPKNPPQAVTASCHLAKPFDLPALPQGFNLPAAVAELERQALEHALHAAHFRQTEAARLLGLTYHQFRALYRKHN